MLLQNTVRWRICIIVLLWTSVACTPAPIRMPALPAPQASLADLVISNVTVVDVLENRFIRDQEIVIQESTIVRIGSQPSSPTRGRREIDGSGMIAMPGFINTHTHLWQHLAKGFAPLGQLQDWARVVYGNAHYLTDEEIHRVTMAAADEALLSGITTVLDFASVNFSEGSLEAVLRGLQDSGLGGAVIWWNPAAFLPPAAKEAQIRHLQALGGERVEVWMGFGPLSFFPLPAVYDGIHLAQRLNLRMAEHTMENVQEQRDVHRRLSNYLTSQGPALMPQDSMLLEVIVKAGTPPKRDAVAALGVRAHQLLRELGDSLPAGEREILERLAFASYTSPVPLLEHLGALQDFVAIHAVWPTPDDINRFRKSNVYVSYNPESNMYLASGIAPIIQYSAAGIVVSLGTDGAASNDGIDMFSAMRTAVNLQKVHHLNPRHTAALSPWEVIRMATLNGAQALGRGAKIGALEPGREADIVLLSTNRLGLSPFLPEKNGAALLVNSANTRAIHTVVSDGAVVVWEGQLTRHSEVDLATDLSRIATEVVSRVEAGKTWRDTIRINGEEATTGWRAYRSIRRTDTIELDVVNEAEEAVCIRYAMSGTAFGGTVPGMLHPEVRSRFPGNAPSKWLDHQEVLDSGAHIRIHKAPGSLRWEMSGPDGTVQRDGTDAEQLYVAAARSCSET